MSARPKAIYVRIPGRSYYDLKALISHITSSLKGGLIVVDPVHCTLHTTIHDQLSSILWVLVETPLGTGELGLGIAVEYLPDKSIIQPSDAYMPLPRPS